MVDLSPAHFGAHTSGGTQSLQEGCLHCKFRDHCKQQCDKPHCFCHTLPQGPLIKEAGGINIIRARRHPFLDFLSSSAFRSIRGVPMPPSRSQTPPGLYDGHGSLPFTESKSGGAIAEFVKTHLRTNITDAMVDVARGLLTRGLVRNLRTLHHPHCPLPDRVLPPRLHHPRATLADALMSLTAPQLQKAVDMGFEKTNSQLREYLRQSFLGCYSDHDVTYFPMSRKHHWCWLDEHARLKQHNAAIVNVMGSEYLMDPSHTNCIAMTRALGDFEYEPVGLLHQPEVTHHMLTGWREFVLVLCSDGVTDVMPPDDVVKFLGEFYQKFLDAVGAPSKQRITEEACTALINKAKAVRGGDILDVRVGVVPSRPVPHIPLTLPSSLWSESGFTPDTDNISAIVVFLRHTPLNLAALVPGTEPMAAATTSTPVASTPVALAPVAPVPVPGPFEGTAAAAAASTQPQVPTGQSGSMY
ncbi:hypothetical protein PAPYR_8746 [Paratrimastix pyriformis]|uniref:PPM-type phosphatase domain-containing protein n=1 Tax=Paratrimastix pyriformis TaxID=342808 RepID=A0ABQ8UBI3_9EUKA|nr:hypothetical protein PAPYR_8746 [Paratrimastix pyriformis]